MENHIELRWNILNKNKGFRGLNFLIPKGILKWFQIPISLFVGLLYNPHIYLQLSPYDYIVQSLVIAQIEWFIKKHTQNI
jgi:hypothetical protein